LNEITIPYHLAIPAIICLIGLMIIFFYRKKLFSTNKLLWSSLTMFLFLYFLIVGSASFYDIYYQWDLNHFDLDKDGFFSSQEITIEKKAAMQRLTNDVGRNFSFITGFIFALIISAVVYVFGRIYPKLKRQ